MLAHLTNLSSFSCYCERVVSPPRYWYECSTIIIHILFTSTKTDGSDLLQISTDYNVHVAVTPNPLALKIEGLRGSLKKLEALIAEKRKVMIYGSFIFISLILSRKLSKIHSSYLPERQLVKHFCRISRGLLVPLLRMLVRRER